MLNYTVDADGIATLEWDYPGKSQNILNEASLTTFVEACRMALADSSVRGLLVCSAKSADLLAEREGRTDEDSVSRKMRTYCEMPWRR